VTHIVVVGGFSMDLDTTSVLRLVMSTMCVLMLWPVRRCLNYFVIHYNTSEHLWQSATYRTEIQNAT